MKGYSLVISGQMPRPPLKMSDRSEGYEKNLLSFFSCISADVIRSVSGVDAPLIDGGGDPKGGGGGDG